MKKHTLVLVAFLFVFGLFVINAKFANAFPPGCSSDFGFSSVNGASCGCESASGFNSFTGGFCGTTPTPLAPTTPPVCTNGFDPTNGWRCGCNSDQGFSSVNGESCAISQPAPTPTPTPVCTNGFDPTTGFICGCTSIVGYSLINGASCNPTPTPTPACSHGFNLTTGAALPCGCNLASGFSTTNGESCGTYSNQYSTISSISPSSAKIGDTVWVYGSNFNSNSSIWISQVNDNRAQQEWLPANFSSSSLLYFVVPQDLGSGTRSISVHNNTVDESLSNYVDLKINNTTSVCSTSGFDSSTGFLCGCTSNVGWSTTTGNSCSVGNLPAGCNSTDGFSTVTGNRCDGIYMPPVSVSYPSGCTSTSGFSTTTGESCGGNTNSYPTYNPPSTPSSSCTITSTLRLGSTGSDVACLQLHIGLISDGKFGLRTQIAVKAFQVNAGLVADGVVGPRSIAVLEVAN